MWLTHFTRASNLPSIMANGLLPRSTLEQNGQPFIFNDEHRFDGHRGSNSLSISFPNYSMFFKYRKLSPGTDWVVLFLNPAILWELRCAYCKYNAATAAISSTPPERLISAQAFDEMFEEINGLPSRTDSRLKPSDPTDHQAEVLVFDAISPDYIQDATFETAEARGIHRHHLGNRDAFVETTGKGFFASRSYARLF